MVACMFLVAAIFWGGEESPVPQSESWFAVLPVDDPLMTLSLVWYQGIGEIESVDAATVAECLNMSEDSDLWDFATEADESIEDQIADLTPDSMDEVLNNIEALSFFEDQGTPHEG